MASGTRVKYVSEGGVYRTTKKFLGNEGTLLQVTIDPTTNLVQLIKFVESGEELVEAVHSETFSKAKLDAKTLLKKYGVVFMEEVRNRNKGDSNA